MIRSAHELRQRLRPKALLAQLADCSALPEAALWNGTTDEFAAKAVTVGVLSTENEDIRSLRELITYGLKGLAAYTSHANVLFKKKTRKSMPSCSVLSPQRSTIPSPQRN